MSTAEHQQRADVLEGELQISCEYGQQLWQCLQRVREYLLESVPPPSVQPGTADQRGARPTGPDDEDGWAQWMQMYAQLSTVLIGPRGDSGYGRDEARQQARLRRNAASPAPKPQDPDAIPPAGPGELPNSTTVVQRLRAMRGPDTPSGDGVPSRRAGTGREATRLALVAAAAFVTGSVVRRRSVLVRAAERPSLNRSGPARP